MIHSDSRIVGVVRMVNTSGIGSMMSCYHFLDFGRNVFDLLAETNFLSLLSTLFLITAAGTTSRSALWSMFSSYDWLVCKVMRASCGGLHVVRIGWRISCAKASAKSCSKTCMSETLSAVAGSGSSAWEALGSETCRSNTCACVKGGGLVLVWIWTCVWWVLTHFVMKKLIYFESLI